MARPCAVVAFVLLALLLATVAAAPAPATATAAGRDTNGAGVYIVMVRPPAAGVACEKYQMRILATALGSAERAKAALIYSYKEVVSGFAAKLTPQQLAALQRHPDVLQALPEVNYSLQENHIDNNN